MTDPRETLARIRAQADAATPGPWETDGTGEVSQHWSRPEPWETVVGTGVSCMSYCYGGSAKGAERAEDAKFIAASRTDVPALVGTLEKVLERHAPMPIYVLAEDCEAPDDHQHGSTPDGGDDLCWDEPTGEVHCRECLDGWGESVEYPCPTVIDITTELEALMRGGDRG